MYRHYEGNSGRSRVVQETGRERGRYQGKVLYPMPEMVENKRGKAPPQHKTAVRSGNTTQNDRGAKNKNDGRVGGQKPRYEAPPSPLSGLSGELGKIFGKLGSLSLETEDLLLLAVLYLMYRESGDKELLIMMGALLFL